MSLLRRLLAALLLAALCVPRLAAQDAIAPAADTPAAELSTAYMLQPLDLLRVLVFQEPDLAREVRVSQDYTIALPLIGNISVRGKSIRDAEEIIRGAYDKDYLVNPQINLIVVEYAPRTVNVIGMVNQPGAVKMPPEQQITLLDVISRAGGFNRLANRKSVRVTRNHPDGRIENFTVNADELMSGNERDTTRNTWIMQNNDIVFVPESRI